MATWFTSDQHFFHYNILHYCSRHFLNIYEMNEAIIANYNELVAPGDIVYHLGDFSLNKDAAEKILPKLNGIKHLVAGNHDLPFKEAFGLSKSNIKINRWKEAGFSSISRCMQLQIAGQAVLLSHFPYQNPTAEDQRYQDLRPVDNGGWICHGHSHNPPERRVRGKSIDIGVDANFYKPVPLEFIEQIIKG